MTLADKILISSILIVSLLFILLPLNPIAGWGGQKSENQVFVIKSVNETKKIPVEDTYTSEPQLFSIKGPTGETEVEVHNGKIRVKEEPEEHIHRIAEKQGWMSPSSMMNTIINLPNKISITVEDPEAEEQKIDGVTE